MNPLILVFISVSSQFNLPQGLLSSVCFVESSHNVGAIHYNDGKGNSVGVCQLKLATAKLLGFKGNEQQLKNYKVNVFYAGKYLKKQLDRYNGNADMAVAAYNAGKCRINKKGLIKNIKYVNKVRKVWISGRELADNAKN